VAKTATKRDIVHLRLYVAGNAPNSVRAIANAKAICLEHYGDNCELEIVDLMEQPLRALADEIIVTPTLLRLQPLPMRRVIGNLNDLEQVFLALGAK
jgi:circadian clock protein KaiB